MPFHLQVLDPTKRLGCDECEGYPPLKEHPFYQGNLSTTVISHSLGIIFFFFHALH